jgi:integrase/recombinase XerC
MVRGGHDLVVVAELAGHRRLETTRRYSLPNDADRQAAVDSLEVESDGLAEPAQARAA